MQFSSVIDTCITVHWTLVVNNALCTTLHYSCTVVNTEIILQSFCKRMFSIMFTLLFLHSEVIHWPGTYFPSLLKHTITLCNNQIEILIKGIYRFKGEANCVLLVKSVHKTLLQQNYIICHSSLWQHENARQVKFIGIALFTI